MSRAPAAALAFPKSFHYDGPIAMQSPPRWIIWVVVTLVLVVRAKFAAQLPLEDRPDPDDYQALATNLMEDGSFAVDYWRNSPIPTAYRPPLYPLLLAPLTSLNSIYIPITIALLHLLLGGATLKLVWIVAGQYGVSAWFRLLAVALVGLDPILLRQSSLVMTETLATFLAALGLYTLAYANVNHRWSVLAGITLGLCILCRPTFLVWAALVLGYRLLRLDGWGRTLSMACALAITVAPWVIRNAIVFGKPIVATTHGGYTLFLANNDAYYEHLLLQPWGSRWNSTTFNRNLDSMFRSQGLAFPLGLVNQAPSKELERDALCYRLAWEAISKKPVIFALASVHRLTRLFGVVPTQLQTDERWPRRFLRWSVGAFYAVEFTLVLVGIIAVGRRITQPPWVWTLLLVLSFALVHAFYWTDMRMRAPLVPAIALWAAAGAAQIWRCVSRRNSLSE